jgi:hypothetical protein
VSSSEAVKEVAASSEIGAGEDAIKEEEIKLEEVKEVVVEVKKKEEGPVEREPAKGAKKELDETKRKEKDKKDREEMISMVLELVQEDTA